MQVLHDLIGNVKALDEKQVFTDFFNDKTEHKIFVLDLNRWDQLYRGGVDANGRQLGDYAPYTLEHKKDPMKDHITLHEEGDFYRSFELTVNYGSLEIDAETQKPNGDLADIFGEDILGLTANSRGELAEYMIEEELAELIIEKILP